MFPHQLGDITLHDPAQVLKLACLKIKFCQMWLVCLQIKDNCLAGSAEGLKHDPLDYVVPTLDAPLAGSTAGMHRKLAASCAESRKRFRVIALCKQGIAYLSLGPGAIISAQLHDVSARFAVVHVHCKYFLEALNRPVVVLKHAVGHTEVEYYLRSCRNVGRLRQELHVGFD